MKRNYLSNLSKSLKAKHTIDSFDLKPSIAVLRNTLNNLKNVSNKKFHINKSIDKSYDKITDKSFEKSVEKLLVRSFEKSCKFHNSIFIPQNKIQISKSKPVYSTILNVSKQINPLMKKGLRNNLKDNMISLNTETKKLKKAIQEVNLNLNFENLKRLKKFKIKESKKSLLSKSQNIHNQLKEILSNNENLKRPPLPISSEELLHNYPNNFNKFIKKEISQVPIIFYLPDSVYNSYFSSNESANIFDDENGNYLSFIGDHIYYRYEIISFLGKGSFGQVLKCLDHKTNKYVALKMIRNKKKLLFQAKVEEKILRYLTEKNSHKIANTIELLDSFEFRGHIVNLKIVPCF